MYIQCLKRALTDVGRSLMSTLSAARAMLPTARDSKACLKKWASVSPKSRKMRIYRCSTPGAVREHAEDRLFGNVGALKKIKEKNPDFKIILCGCMMQQERIAEKIQKSYPFVDIVFGTHAAHKFPELLYRALSTGKRVFDIENSDGVIAEDFPLHRDSTFKAWLPIMYGCNNFCTYCIVPYVRGRERSRSSDIIISEAREALSRADIKK